MEVFYRMLDYCEHLEGCSFATFKTMNLKAIEIQKKKLRTTFRKQFGGGRSIGL